MYSSAGPNGWGEEVGEGLRIIEGFDDFDSPIITASADLQTTFSTQLQLKEIQKLNNISNTLLKLTGIKI